MSDNVAQSEAGIPEKRRGQQTGTAGHPDKSLQEKANTPALHGRRKEESRMFADDSTQHIASDAAKPSTNSPAVPAAIPSDQPLGESGGERVFKERHAKKG
jgi:hypothetical protein